MLRRILISLALFFCPLLWSGLAAGQAVPPLVLSSCDDPAEWSGGTADTGHVKQGKASLRWEHAKADGISLAKVPADWSAYDRLSFWVYSEKATNSSFMLIISSENPETEGPDYYSRSIRLNFTGWKRFRCYLQQMSAARQPLGWNQIHGLRFTASGWGNEPHPEAVVCIDDVILTHEGKEVGPRMTDEQLFEALNLEYPGLGEVKAAVAKGDLAAAKRALAQYYRNRQTPKWYFPAGAKADPKPENPDTARADRVLRHELESIGLRHQFGPEIDWTFDLTTAPGSKYAPNNEWTWQLNRHADWSALARAYRDTGDERYAREFTAQMMQWVRTCPVPEDAANTARSTWRTIEAGIRAAQVWPDLFYRFLLSPEFTDEALVTMVKSFAEHAMYLLPHPTSGNWLCMEGNGLFHVGVLFPEFKDAAKWRDTAVEWLYAEMENQVYPDGVQIELSSGYHHVSLSNFLGVFRLAQLNDIALPADYLKRIERMYDFDVYAAMPDRRLPGVQDGCYMDIRRPLGEAARLFPERKEFLWYATDGKEGEPPAKTSYAFPYAGYFIMRSGWEPDACWMLFDGGPFGYGHQHEDKLNVIVHAYGKLLLVDPGNYQYERSKWRQYFIDSAAHNVVLVDGQPQRRRGRPRSEYVVKEPLPHVWATAPEYDYVEATFDEGFGGEVKQGVAHTRRVLFVKPDLWILCDTLSAKDGKEHSYEALFHLDAPVKADAAGLRLFTGNEDAANLAIAARPASGLSLKIVEGQQDPLQGWLPDRGLKSAHPAPVAVFTATGGGDTHLLWVLAPARPGAPDPVAAIEPLGDNRLSARIRLRDGRAYEVAFSGGSPADLRVGAARGRGRALLVETRPDGQPGRTIVAAP